MEPKWKPQKENVFYLSFLSNILENNFYFIIFYYLSIILLAYIYPSHCPHQLCGLPSLLSTNADKEKATQMIKQCMTNLAIIFQNALNIEITEPDWAVRIYDEKFGGLDLETLIKKIYAEKESIVNARNSLSGEYCDYYTKIIKQGKETVRDTKDVFVSMFEKLLEQKRQEHLNVSYYPIGVVCILFVYLIILLSFYNYDILFIYLFL